MIDANQMVKEYHEMVDKAGGSSAVLSRLLVVELLLLLSLRAKKEEESVVLSPKITVNNHDYYPDIYTETGIKRLRTPPHSCFEIKTRLISDSVNKVNRIAVAYKQAFPDANFYLIYGERGVITDTVLREAKIQNVVQIYQIDDFLARIEKTRKINDQVDLFERDWHEKRDIIIDDAKFSFRENKCSLFLGAGVSMSAGGPSWETLLFKAIKKNHKTITKRDFKKIFASCGQSPIVMGRYVAPDSRSLDMLSNYLKQHVLYKDVDINHSELIKSICECVETEKVESIITYNYDDLVETALEQRGRKRAISIFEKSRNTKDEIPVYHVHGLIPQFKSDIASTPVLSEKDYHDIYRKSYHWSNIEQLHALDRNTCFFIGLSMTDPNLRRLLDFSHTDSDNEIHHYAFLKRNNLYKDDDVEKNKRYFDTFEQQLENIGVSVVWYESHDELPGIIRRIIASMEFVNV